ncbi:MAG TPA: glycine zipper 2TM domain-containing protein [Limnobacter sp.]|uniref:glycine zipper 2TM domain-containing protein n=1 Tax=Limnobacter sp. TaxID=2003368 RepID=UPI002ED9543F
MEGKRTHPLFITAAAAVILTCGIAIASMTGLLPSSKAENPLPEDVAAVDNNTSAKTAEADKAGSKPATSHKTTTTHHSTSPAYSGDSSPAPAQVAAVCRDCGRVSDVRAIKVEGEGTGLGAIAGGVAGALLGKQFGNGRGQTAMTVAGAAGGAYVGNKIEKDRRSSTVYDVVVTFDDGTTRTFRENNSSWQVGDRVKVVNGQIASAS